MKKIKSLVFYFESNLSLQYFYIVFLLIGNEHLKEASFAPLSSFLN